MAARPFVQMARAHAGVPVLHQDFHALDLSPASFDGIFANASLFHVPTAHLPRSSSTCTRRSSPGGALFCSNPRPPESEPSREGFLGERYASHLDLEDWRALFTAAGFGRDPSLLPPRRSATRAAAVAGHVVAPSRLVSRVPASAHTRAFLQVHLCVLVWASPPSWGASITIPAIPLVIWRMLLVSVILVVVPRVRRGVAAMSGRHRLIYSGIG